MLKLELKIFVLPFRYIFEKIKWVLAGKPVRSPEKIRDIFQNKCRPCKHFDKISEEEGTCSICGCFLHESRQEFNKIYWATTKCPDKPPRWN